MYHTNTNQKKSGASINISELNNEILRKKDSINLLVCKNYACLLRLP